MKLHLPKQLFTALLAAFTLIAPAALTIGSTAWGEAETVSASAEWGSDTQKTYETGEYLSVSGSGTTLTLSGATITGGAVLSLQSDGANVIINEGSNVEISRLVTHDGHDDSTSENVTVNEGAVLTVTDSDTGTGNFWTAVLLGHWRSATSTALNVSGGQLNVQNGTVQLGFSSAGQLNVTDGEANIKKIDVRSGALNLSGGRLNIGTGGISGLANQTVTLSGGTLGALDSNGWTLSHSGTTTIGSIIVDTNMYTPGAGVGSGSSGAGVNISLLGDLVASNASTSTITLAGAGSLTIDHTWDGTLSLAEGATAQVHLQNVNNFDIVDYADAEGTVGTSGFANSIRVANSSSTFHNDEVYIGGNVYSVAEGVATGVFNAAGNTMFYVNEDLNYNATTMAGATGFTVGGGSTLTFGIGSYSFSALKGNGAVSMTNSAVVTMTSPVNYAGTVQIDGTDSGLKLAGTGASAIADLELKNGAVLTVFADDGAYSHTLANVEVDGSGIIFVSSNGKYYEACVNIGNLTNSGDAAGILVLKSEFKNSTRNVFNLQGGSFNGEIQFVAASTGTRKFALNIADKTVAENAVIRISNATTNAHTMALGIGAPTVIVKGVTGDYASSAIYSSSQVFGNGNDFASDSTFRTLVINTDDADANYSTKAAIQSNLNLIKTGTGGQAFTGDMSAFNGLIEVQEGTLTIGAADNSTTTDLGLGGTIVNNGILNLNTKLATSDTLGFAVTNTAGKQDGFQTGNLTYMAVDGTGTVNLGTNCTQITVNGTAADLTQDGSKVTFEAAAAANTYYVFTSTANTSSVVAGEGQTLSNIYIADGGMLAYDSGSFSNVTLTGSGVYKLAAGATALTTGVTLGNGWTGTVMINDTARTYNLEGLNTLGTQTKLALKAAAGYLWNSSNSTGKFAADLLLINGDSSNNYAIKLDNGSSSEYTNVEFSGKIEGSGDVWYTFDGNSGSYTATHEFSGDLSEWNGKFIRKAGATTGKNVTAKFTSGGDVFQKLENGVGGNGGVEDADNSGKMSVVIEAADGTETFFNGSITNVATLTVNTDTTFNASLTGIGTATVAAEKALTLGSGAHSIGTLTTGSGSTVTLNSGANLTLTSVSGVSGKIVGEGTLTLNTGNRFNGNNGIPTTLFASTLNELVLTGNGTCLEITGSGQKNSFANIQNLVIENGATFGNRLTGQTIGSATHTLTLAGAGNGSGASAAAIAFGNETSYSDDMTIAHTVHLADDATVWVNASRRGILSGTVNGANHVLTKTGSGELVLQGEVKSTSLAVDEGTLNIAGTSSSETVDLNGGTLKLGSVATITSRQDANATMTKASMSTAGISSTATDGTKGTISNANVEIAQLAEDASFTIQDMTLTNTTISAATPTTQVKLQNVAATNLELAQGKFTMNAAPTVGTGGTTANFGTNTDSSFMISKLMAGSASLTLNLDVMGAYESTGAVDNVTLTITLAGITGDVSSYDVDAWKALVGFEESSWLGQALTGAQYSVDDVATAAEGGVPSVSYGYAATGGEGSNVGTLTITIAGLNVPEPASATLGLAALMMLCARRRRKA